MSGKNIFSKTQFFKKAINTFCPKILLQISPSKNGTRLHWRDQQSGDIHGYEKYCNDRPNTAVILTEIKRSVPKDAPIMDLGCNCGYYLSRLKEEGYSNLTGIDICGNAIEYGKAHLGLSDAEMITGSFDEVLPCLCAENRKFSLVYSIGVVELVHPSFDIIRYICEISAQYVILLIAPHAYVRFWEYEFNKNGFFLVKCETPYVTPFDDNTDANQNPGQGSSLLVFKKIR